MDGWRALTPRRGHSVTPRYVMIYPVRSPFGCVFPDPHSEFSHPAGGSRGAEISQCYSIINA